MNFKLSPHHPARFAHHKMDVLLAHSHKRNPQSSSKTPEWDFGCLSCAERVSSVRGSAVSSNEPSDSVKDDFGVHNGRRETRLCVCVFAGKQTQVARQPQTKFTFSSSVLKTTHKIPLGCFYVCWRCMCPLFYPHAARTNGFLSYFLFALQESYFSKDIIIRQSNQYTDSILRWIPDTVFPFFCFLNTDFAHLKYPSSPPRVTLCSSYPNSEILLVRLANLKERAVKLSLTFHFSFHNQWASFHLRIKRWEVWKLNMWREKLQRLVNSGCCCCCCCRRD